MNRVTEDSFVADLEQFFVSIYDAIQNNFKTGDGLQVKFVGFDPEDGTTDNVLGVRISSGVKSVKISSNIIAPNETLDQLSKDLMPLLRQYVSSRSNQSIRPVTLN